MPALVSLLSFGSASGGRTESSRESLEEAREALAYWSARHARLPWHRRAARAESRDMIARWHGRLVNAHLERWGLDGSHPLAPLVGLLVLRPRDQARWARSLVLSSRAARRVRRAAIATAVAGLAVFVGLVVLVSQLL